MLARRRASAVLPVHVSGTAGWLSATGARRPMQKHSGGWRDGHGAVWCKEQCKHVEHITALLVDAGHVLLQCGQPAVAGREGRRARVRLDDDMRVARHNSHLRQLSAAFCAAAVPGVWAGRGGTAM